MRLLRVLNTNGLRGVEQVIRGARVPGLEFENAPHIAGMRRWIARDAAWKAELYISVNSNRYFKSAMVTWLAMRPAPRMAQARRRKQLQDQFYARYLAAGERAYATPPLSISAADREILLVGELEADVNNGGFSQYLFNKGRRRGAAALRALERIGAVKTAEMLRAALAPSTTEATLGTLDAKFYRSREDLAVLAITKSSKP